MSYTKLNLLHLHLSDDLGIRIASDKHPNIVSQQFYTKEDIAELVSLAEKYHVTIIPEVDVPGHTGWLRESYPELILGNNDLGTYYMDITQQKSYKLVRDIIEEFTPLFPGPYWHTGADEYIGADNYSLYPQLDSFAKASLGSSANGFDSYLLFLDSIHTWVTSKGKQLRTWGDAYEYNAINKNSPVPLKKDIIQELWNAYQHPEEILAAGFSIMNSSFHPTYYNLGAYKGGADTLYEKWTPHNYLGGWERDNWGYPIAIDSAQPGLLGAKLSIWCDYPDLETEEEVAEGIYHPLRAVAQNSWGGDKLVSTYEEFRLLIEEIGRAPGYSEQDKLIEKVQSPYGTIPTLQFKDDELHMYAHSSTKAHIEFHTLTGRLISSQTIGITKGVNIIPLLSTQGVFLVSVATEEKKYTTKVAIH